MGGRRVSFFFLNLGHLYDHLFLLLFPTAVIALEREWGASYGELIALSTGSFIAFAAGTLPAGWLADRWRRDGMIAVFFMGIGASSVLTGFATGPVSLAVCLTLIGLFAAIYHPVGIAMVVGEAQRVGIALGINGVAGNLGVASAALAAGVLSDVISWRAAFIAPGVLSVLTGFAYLAHIRARGRQPFAPPKGQTVSTVAGLDLALMIRVMAIIAVMGMAGGIIFNATTVTIPKVLDEGIADFAVGLSGIGGIAAVVFTVAAMAQLVVGWMIDRFDARTILLCVVVPQMLLLAWLAQNLDGPLLIIVATVLMLMVFGQIPINDALITRYSFEGMRSRMLALKYLLGLGVSSLAVPLIALLRQTSADFVLMFWILAAAAVLVTLAALALPRRRRILALAEAEAAAGD